MTHQTGPCGWTVEVCDTCCSDAVTGLPTWDIIQDMAASFLWRATGRVFGLCAQTYRPCARSCFDGGSGLPTPYRFGGSWYNLSCASCAGSCSCRDISEIWLPGTYAVTGLVIDGAPLDPESEVLVYDHSRIVRADGQQWPTCQDLSLPSDAVSGQAGTWEITILSGSPVPAGGELMAGILACELAKACIEDDSCRLPKRVQTITRQGITVGFQDAFENLPDMLTGLWEVDAWITSARATGWREPTIGSPDLPDFPQLTWPLP